MKLRRPAAARPRALRACAWIAAASVPLALVATAGSDPLPAASISAPAPAPRAAPAAAEPPASLVGDATLRGQIRLDRARRVGDRYEVALPGGERAILTLDPTLQAAAEKVLEQARAPYGAVVVMTTDGRLLAVAGRDASDPKVAARADFTLPMSVWAPAASIFKLVTASALVEDGVGPGTEVCYHGGFRSLDASNLKDLPRQDKACRDLTFGVSESQNAIMAKLAHKHLAPARLLKAAASFGFGSTPEFALTAELGRVELPEAPLEFARAAAGFWHSELSPLGGALLANTLASGGLAVTPRVVAAVIGADGYERAVVGAAPRRVLTKKVAGEVGRMMVATTTSGTAFPAFHDRRGRPFLTDISVAGKTGSLTRDKPSYLAYSWFVGYAPADAPQVVIAVLLGNPPKWYLKAHTAARLVLEAARPRLRARD